MEIIRLSKQEITRGFVGRAIKIPKYPYICCVIERVTQNIVWTTPPDPETAHVDTTSHQPVSIELTPPDTSSLNATIHAPPL
ncbi:1889_t:CDS:2 [Rhizophagus irregularis]|nr:1889_t:CDS:2 [Rhizophagus irregularis]